MELPYPDPKRGLQFYDRDQQAQFKGMTIQARLEWLAGINELYWAGVRARESQARSLPNKPEAA